MKTLYYKILLLLIEKPIYKRGISIVRMKNKKEIIILSLIVLLYNKVDIVYSMEHGKQALDVARALAENNINQAEQLLQQLRDSELTAQQYRDLNNIINRSIETNRENDNYQVQNLELQNAGNVPEEPFNVRGLLVTLTIIATSTLTIYLIIHYWEDIRDFLFHHGSTVIPQTVPVLRMLLLARYELVRNNPNTLQEISNYLNNIPEE